MFYVPPPLPPEPHRSMYDSEEKYQRALQSHRELKERRREMMGDQEAVLILFGIALALVVVCVVCLALYVAGGFKAIAQGACVFGLLAIGTVYAYRFIRARI